VVDPGEDGARQPRPPRGGVRSRAPRLDQGKQDKHIAGSNNYIPGRSILTDPDPQALPDLAAGTGQPGNDVPIGRPGTKERVDFGKVIGHYIDPVTCVAHPMPKGDIVYDRKGGAHIVTARP
jgi:filamentous hemagglutinin